MSRHVASRPALPVIAIVALLLSLVATLALPAPVAAQTELFAELSGSAEVPGPGDDDGIGFASLLVAPEDGEVCVFLQVIDIAPATMVHIHAGGAGVAGAIVVTLPTPDADGFGEGCVSGLDGPTLQAIIDDPAGHYVNVHNTDFPDGAIRGQLAVPPPPPVVLFAELAGAAEVPGLGDPDGTGSASLLLVPDSAEVCAFIEVVGIATATAAHVHLGAAGVAGEIVLTLPTPGADGSAEGCTDGHDVALLQAIIDDPAGHYVNVHNAEFPDGALRGQLMTDLPPPPPCEQPGELCNGPLEPGMYTYTGFGTALTFTTVTEWFALIDEVPSLTLFDDGLGGGLFAFPFTGDIFMDACNFESGTTIGDTPDDVIAWLTDRSPLSATAPTSVTYGGASGLQIDVAAVTLPKGCTDPPWVLLFPLPIVGDFHLEEGSVARIVALDVNGETILLIAESFPGGSTDEFLARAQGVLDSMVWSLETDGGGPLTPSPGSGEGSLPDTAMRPGSVSMSLLAGVGLLCAVAVVAARRRAQR